MKYTTYLLLLGVLLFYILGANNVAYAQTSAKIFFDISTKQVEEWESFTVHVKIQSQDQAINAISGVFSFPRNLVNFLSISKESSIVNFWTEEPRALVSQGQIKFEGVILNPGFQGGDGLLFTATFQAKKSGDAFLNFISGSVLANDGQGTNVLANLSSDSLRINPGDPTLALDPNRRLLALPVIVDYSPLVDPKSGLYLKGKGEPGAKTKIIFKDISIKSVGEKLIALLQINKEKLDEVVVLNDSLGGFQYESTKNLLAGVYNVTPFLVDRDTNTEKSGFGVQLLVSDSQIVRALVVVINVLGLLIPIVLLGVIIYFIPWYSWRRMQVTRKKLGLEEEKLNLSLHRLEHQGQAIEKGED